MPATPQQAEAVRRLLELIRRAQDAVHAARYPGGDPTHLTKSLDCTPTHLEFSIPHSLDAAIAALTGVEWQVVSHAMLAGIDLPEAPSVWDRASAWLREDSPETPVSKD